LVHTVCPVVGLTEQAGGGSGIRAARLSMPAAAGSTDSAKPTANMLMNFRMVPEAARLLSSHGEPKNKGRQLQPTPPVRS
jgi:hypothetical protein